LFDDLILNIRVSDLCKEVNQEDNKKETREHWRNFAQASPMQTKKMTIG
jgi:hypothetical protein